MGVAFHVPLEGSFAIFTHCNWALAFHDLHLGLVNELEGHGSGTFVAEVKVASVHKESWFLQLFDTFVDFGDRPLTSGGLAGLSETTTVGEGVVVLSIAGQLVIGVLTVTRAVIVTSVLDSSFFSIAKLFTCLFFLISSFGLLKYF